MEISLSLSFPLNDSLLSLSRERMFLERNCVHLRVNLLCKFRKIWSYFFILFSLTSSLLFSVLPLHLHPCTILICLFTLFFFFSLFLYFFFLFSLSSILSLPSLSFTPFLSLFSLIFRFPCLWIKIDWSIKTRETRNASKPAFFSTLLVFNQEFSLFSFSHQIFFIFPPCKNSIFLWCRHFHLFHHLIFSLS